MLIYFSFVAQIYNFSWYGLYISVSTFCIFIKSFLRFMQQTGTYPLLVILGPTASGKTLLAAHVAHKLNGEIISADSRQVYRRMDLGTGKDYDDYLVEGVRIPVHLIDILEPGSKYNVYDYQKDFLATWHSIHEKGKLPVMCGGTGLYIEAVIRGYQLLQVPVNPELRLQWESMGTNQLVQMISSLTTLHNTMHIVTRKRLYRALEIAMYQRENAGKEFSYPEWNLLIVGIRYEREHERERITRRLRDRIENGMIDEVKNLLKEVKPEDLMYYGLEYKWITRYVLGEISFDDMFSNLNTAIHQFAKRQRTWFRRMERNGADITWLRGEDDPEQNILIIEEMVKHHISGPNGSQRK